MDKKILEDYIDACELIKETEKDIQRLKKKKKTIIQTNVKGSNPDLLFCKLNDATNITLNEAASV